MRAAIDLGSNSVLLTIVDGHGGLVHDEARVVGLGRGLGDQGDFASDRMEAALDALRDYASIASSHGIVAGDVRAVTTSAARRARNAATFFERVAVECGIRFRILSGAEEARLTFAGGVTGLALEGSVAVVDLGGGSTEIAIGTGELTWRHSFEIGTIRLTESVLGEGIRPADAADLEALHDSAATRFETQAIPTCDHVVGVAGTATSLLGTHLGLTTYDGERIHGGVLTRETLAGFQQRLLGADAAERRAVFALSPKRADTLLAGAVILDEALKALGRSSMRVSDRGLRFGVLR